MVNTQRFKANIQWTATTDLLNTIDRINDLAKPNRPTQNNRASEENSLTKCQDIYLVKGLKETVGGGFRVTQRK